MVPDVILDRAGLRHQECTGQIQTHHGVPMLNGHFRNGFASNQAARVVDQNVDASKNFDSAIHQRVNIRSLVQVSLQGDRLTAIGFDCSDGFVRAIRAGKVVNHNICAFRGELE